MIPTLWSIAILNLPGAIERKKGFEKQIPEQFKRAREQGEAYCQGNGEQSLDMVLCELMIRGQSYSRRILLPLIKKDRADIISYVMEKGNIFSTCELPSE